MDLVYRQWSSKHHQTVNGINLETVVWTKNDTNKCLEISAIMILLLSRTIGIR